jgi:hypothetical protein
MKYCLLLPVLLAGLAACGNPVSPALKWIGTPGEDNTGFSEIFSNVKNPTGLLTRTPAGFINFGDTVSITVIPGNGLGPEAPYTGPVEWYLDSNVPLGTQGSSFTITDTVNDSVIVISTTSLGKGSHWVMVVVRGSDEKYYTVTEHFTVN